MSCPVNVTADCRQFTEVTVGMARAFGNLFHLQRFGVFFQIEAIHFSSPEAE